MSLLLFILLLLLRSTPLFCSRRPCAEVRPIVVVIVVNDVVVALSLSLRSRRPCVQVVVNVVVVTLYVAFPLAGRARKFALKQFSRVCCGYEYLSLRHDELESLIQDDQLNVKVCCYLTHGFV